MLPFLFYVPLSFLQIWAGLSEDKLVKAPPIITAQVSTLHSLFFLNSLLPLTILPVTRMFETIFLLRTQQMLYKSKAVNI